MDRKAQDRKLGVEELEKRAAPFGDEPLNRDEPLPGDVIIEDPVIDAPGGSDDHRKNPWKKSS